MGETLKFCYRTMKSVLALTCLLLGAFSADANSLTKANFDAKVTSTGKDSFIKFQAPW